MFFDKILDAMNLENIEARRQEKLLAESSTDIDNDVSLSRDENCSQDYCLDTEIQESFSSNSEQLEDTYEIPNQIIETTPPQTDVIETIPQIPEINEDIDSLSALDSYTFDEFISDSSPESDSDIIDSTTKPVEENKLLQESDNETMTDFVSEEEPILEPEPQQIYESERIFIRGISRRFISVTREIINTGNVIPIALMREFHLENNDLNRILSEAQTAQLLDKNNNVLVTKEYFEKFIDHYEPSLYQCAHCNFDKEMLICIGEITLESGADSLYEEFEADVLLDYFEILEHMNIIKYDSITNQYLPLVSIDDFREECLYIPDSTYNQLSKKTVASLDDLDGHDFEYYCADLLRDNGFLDVEVTQGSGDHGIDILARKDDITYAIQCKCYSSNVGNAAIQQVNTGKQLYRKDIAVVLTNQYFTQQAKNEATAIGVKLWDRNKLRQFIEHSNAKKI